MQNLGHSALRKFRAETGAEKLKSLVTKRPGIKLLDPVGLLARESECFFCKEGHLFCRFAVEGDAAFAGGENLPSVKRRALITRCGFFTAGSLSLTVKKPSERSGKISCSSRS